MDYGFPEPQSEPISVSTSLLQSNYQEDFINTGGLKKITDIMLS